MAAPYERRWENRRARKPRSVSDESRDSYYGIPVIHKPHWKWMIILYFFLGGVSAASYVIATIARLFGDREDRGMVRTGYYLSFATFIFCPILLILDLGRPERFLNMLRIFKLRSPMSTGTWAVLLFGFLCSLNALRQAVEDGFVRRPTVVTGTVRRMPAGLVSLIGTIPGLFVSGYTGVLLAATAVPMWTKNHLMIGPLFVASAASNGTAAIALLLSLSRKTSHATIRRLERLDSIALVAELVLMITFVARLGPVISRPMRTGRLGKLHQYGVLGGGILVPLAFQVRNGWLGHTSSRLTTALVSSLVLIGGFLFRYVIVVAGNQSADDPEATFELTRKRPG